MYIDPDKIKEQLNTKSFGENIIYLESIDSTNSYLKNSKVYPLGTVVLAETQTGGRGRRGRSFWSPEGGIYMSLLYKPSNGFDAGKVTSCVALSVCKAIEGCTRLNPKIKWVNDIFINNKKVSGILCEAIANPKTASVESVVIGIGLNVMDNSVPEELRNIVTNLNRESGREVSRNNLIAEIINFLEHDLKSIDTQEFIDELRRRSLVLGKCITVHSQADSYKATAMDLDDNCRLIVKSGEETITLSSGEVSISNV